MEERADLYRLIEEAKTDLLRMQMRLVQNVNEACLTDDQFECLLSAQLDIKVRISMFSCLSEHQHLF